MSKAVRDYTAFKDTSNKLRSLTRNLRRKHKANLVSNIAKNPKSFWRYVNTSLKTRLDIDAIKRIDGSLASSDQEKADLLNSYFSSVFTSEDLSNIPNFEVNEDIPLLDNYYYYYQFCQMTGSHKRITCKRAPRNIYTWMQVDTYN